MTENNAAKNTPETPEVDYGDKLTTEQLDDAGDVSDVDVNAAVEALEGEPTQDDSKAIDDQKTEDSKTEDSKTKDTRIPKSRFDEAVQAERTRAEAAESKLAEYEARQAAPAAETSNQPSIDDEIQSMQDSVLQTRKEWQQALLDNDSARADQLLDAMTQAEMDLDELRLNRASEVTRKVTNEDVVFDARINALEKLYPQIDQESDKYDKRLDVRMGTLYTGLVNGGMTRLNALKEAADILLKPLATPVITPEEADAGKAKNETERTLREKTNQALEKTIEGQPPDAAAVGRTSTKEPVLKPSKMSRKQFEKLSDEQLAVLRGDTV